MLDRRDWQRTDGDVPPMRAGFDGVQPVLRGLRQRTQADYCRHMAEEPGGAFDESWVLLAAAWTELAEETKARSGIAAELTMYSGRQMRP